MDNDNNNNNNNNNSNNNNNDNKSNKYPVIVSRSPRLFTGDTMHVVEVSHINKSGTLRLETYLVENSGSPSYQFLG